MPTILLVDDQEIVLEVCAHVLKRLNGFDVLRASSGNEALEIAAQHQGPIDLLLSDIVMDGGPSGIEVAEQISSSRPETKVLLMSGFKEGERVSDHGWQFIAKPFMPAALLERVETLIQTPTARRQRAARR